MAFLIPYVALMDRIVSMLFYEYFRMLLAFYLFTNEYFVILVRSSCQNGCCQEIENKV